MLSRATYLLKRISLELRKKAEGLLRIYGGVDGFSKNPSWLIDTVLRTWFTNDEREAMLNFIFQGMKKDSRLLLMKDLGIR